MIFLLLQYGGQVGVEEAEEEFSRLSDRKG
jgi:hypothetical protein